jgi:hypothetical protein
MDITQADIARIDAKVDGLKRSIDPHNTRKALGERPFMIELWGTPKAGKTTMKEVLKHVSKRLGLSVTTPIEGAEAVEWIKRVEPDYNYQTAEYALTWARQRALGPGHRDFHVGVFDRAIYDGVMRADHYAHMGTIDERERVSWEQYLLLPRHRDYFDFHICMVCDPEEAMRREHAKTLFPQPGETMNHKTMTQLLAAHERVWKRLRLASDPRMLWHDSSGESVVDTAWSVLQACIAALERAAESRKDGMGA